MNIDMDKLKPKKIYNLSLTSNNHKIKKFGNLAFDKDGNFYTDYTKKSENKSEGFPMIFKGNSYLLTLRSTEALKSTNVYY